MLLSKNESTEQALNQKLHYLEQKQILKDEEVLAMRANLEKREQSHSDALNELEAVRREYNTLQHNYQIQVQAQTNSSIWEQKFKEESEKYMSLCHQIGQKDHQLQELEERNKELETQIFDVQLDMDQLQTQHGEEFAASQEKIGHKEKETSKLMNVKDEEILQLKYALQQLKKDQEIKLASTSSEKEEILAVKEAKLDSLMNDLIMKDDEILQNLKTITSLKNQVHDFRHGRETSEIQLEKAKKEIVEMEAKLRSLEAEKSHTKNKIDHLEQELHVYQTSIISREQSKQAELSGLSDRVKDLEEILGTKENDYCELHRKWSEIQTEAETLRQHQTTSELMLKELYEQSTATEEELATRKVKIQQLQEELSFCQAELLSTQEQLELVTNSIPHLPSSEAEAMEGMRKQIISLAHALEKAEVAKLEAIERVAKERKQNAESLRKWTESLKNFYHTTVM